MRTVLYYKLYDELDAEAKRISDILIDNYKCDNNVKIRQIFSSAKKLIKEEYIYYNTEISIRVCFYVYNEFDNQKNAERRNNDLTNTIKYYEYCQQNTEKNHRIISKKIAKLLINSNSNYSLNDRSLARFLSEVIDDFLPQHNDCMDIKAIMLFLQDDIEKEGYTVETINPLKMRKE